MKFLRRLFIVMLIVTLLSFGVLIQRRAVGIVKTIAEATARADAMIAVNDAITFTLSDALTYEDFMSVSRDEKGDITAITSNVMRINRIARDTAYLSQENLKRMSGDGFSVPLGTLTGSQAFAGYGPKIRIHTVPIPSVQTRFLSEFTSSGINQTRHSLYLEVVANVALVLPAARTSVSVTTQVLISESVLIGKVPDTFLESFPWVGTEAS